MAGKNSKKRAPSTGKLPPKPKPIPAAIEAKATKLLADPIAVPNAPVKKSVTLNDNLCKIDVNYDEISNIGTKHTRPNISAE